MWGLEELRSYKVKKPHVTFDTPKNLITKSLQLTGSLTNNINS